MAIPVKEKSPTEVLDYDVDWTNELDSSETISTSGWTVPSGVTKDNDTKSDDFTKIWLSGGTLGTVYRLVNTVVSTEARTHTKTWDLRIVVDKG